ncbi:MAG: hypothetical protein MUO36_01860 [Candidatus Hadarchaeum sp.]|nr:hypothetical protein [Candidatus Hadarchaeum sp.]
MPEAILQTENPFDNAIEKTASYFAESEASQIADIIGENVLPPYLETETSREGRHLKLWDAIREKIHPSMLCGKFGIKGTGQTSYKRYIMFFSCRKWWCSFCGKKGGIIHNRRMSKLIDRIGGFPKGSVLRQVVFTVPEDISEVFGSRAALNSLFRMSEKIIKKIFPGLKCVAYLHLFGDKGAFRYHPHVNIHIFDKPGSLKMLPQKTLDAIREAWHQSLQDYIQRPIKIVDIHYSFQTEPGKIKHRIKYMSRPNPGPKDFSNLKRDIPLLYFCMVVLSGFMFTRYFNGCRSKGVKDASRKDDLMATAGAAGEKIDWYFQDRISRTEFDFIYLQGDYDEISPGFYRIHGP